MKSVIHILGASGSGVTTIGQAISKKWGYAQFDVDDYFWLPTNPPYATKRESHDRQYLLGKDMAASPKCVVSGSLCGWGDIFINQFQLVIFVETPTKIRIERLKKRELQHFGERILPNGDMYKNHIEFLEWAERYNVAGLEQRSYINHTEWLKNITCPILIVNGALPLEEILTKIELAIF